MPELAPSVVVLAGPNGAGKTTASQAVLAKELDLLEFVNADAIAQGLSGFDPDRAAFQAGRVMLTRLRELALARRSFAFETTLASRTFAPFIRDLQTQGYSFQLVYTWLRSADLCIRRVRARVARGGHHVPEGTVRRRYGRSVANLVSLYLPIADSWMVYNNSFRGHARLVAIGHRDQPARIIRVADWNRIQEIARAEQGQPDRD